jgi:hypothetical protein
VSAHVCCEGKRAGGALPHAKGVVKQGAKAGGWVLPGAILVLMPKCPMCVVAYVALVSGVGISMTAAAQLRMGILVVCVGVLGVLVGRAVLRVYRGFSVTG